MLYSHRREECMGLGRSIISFFLFFLRSIISTSTAIYHLQDVRRYGMRWALIEDTEELCLSFPSSYPWIVEDTQHTTLAVLCRWTPELPELKRRHGWFWIEETEEGICEGADTQAGPWVLARVWSTSVWGSGGTAGVWGYSTGWEAAEDGSDVWYPHMGSHWLSKHLVFTLCQPLSWTRHEELISFFMGTVGRVCPIALAPLKEKVPREHLWHIIPWHS